MKLRRPHKRQKPNITPGKVIELAGRLPAGAEFELLEFLTTGQIDRAAALLDRHGEKETAKELRAGPQGVWSPE